MQGQRDGALQDSTWGRTGPSKTSCHEQAQLPRLSVTAPPAPTWVQDGLNDVPAAPLGLHALQLLGP